LAGRSFAILFVMAALLFSNPITARSQDNGGFQKLDTKYIFGFTICSSTGDQGDKAFEPNTKADFGKRGRSYGVGQTAVRSRCKVRSYRPQPVAVCRHAGA
jgi:hypothetical protein